MSTVRAPLIHLESMRRSTWIAGFMLLVCVMRVGMVMACAPHDVAESVAGGMHTMVAADVANDGNSDDPAPDSSAGHCLHCACHFSAALSAAVVALSAATGQDTHARYAEHQANAPPDRDLRPPIV
jgi:hypothetical protein